MERLNLLFQKSRIMESYYDEQYETLDSKLAEYAQKDSYVSLESHKALMTAFSGKWQEFYLSLDKAHKQTFWKSTIKNIQIDPKTHQINGFNFLTKLE